ncbi:hypothetical protein VX159_05570 [Dechloromonas sp. ZY10]|uniref:hypothetical protein n=1 Tax=Dechloromonas aquae TaxID=2664436 RepID=UPI0035281367
MKKKLLIDLIGLLLIALIVVVGYKLSPLLLPQADLVAHPDPGCDLQRQACAVELPGGGRAELLAAPLPIPMVKPFTVRVRVSGLRVSAVEVDFAGIDMNMGLNRPQLVAEGDGRFVGEATLPVCISGQMDWQATVLLTTERGRMALPYRFTTGGGG